jgi:hypothetical protein
MNSALIHLKKTRRSTPILRVSFAISLAGLLSNIPSGMHPGLSPIFFQLQPENQNL